MFRLIIGGLAVVLYIKFISLVIRVGWKITKVIATVLYFFPRPGTFCDVCKGTSHPVTHCIDPFGNCAGNPKLKNCSQMNGSRPNSSLLPCFYIFQNFCNQFIVSFYRAAAIYCKEEL